MDVSAVLKKMRYKDSFSGQVINAPPDMIELESGVSGSREEVDFTLLFIHDQKELNELLFVNIEKAPYDSLFWLAYPKKSSKIKSDVTRDTIWEDMKPKGYRPVSMISIDKTWSAMRVRPADEVK